MTSLIFIGLIGVFAYHCMAITENFKGSSSLFRTALQTIGGIGYLLHYAFLIWAFWQFDWWMPIVTAVASIIVGGITSILFQTNLFGAILSPLLVIVFAILGAVNLANSETHETAYICTGPQSKAYHKTNDCRGLSSCSRDVVKVTVKEAENAGRRECCWCY